MQMRRRALLMHFTNFLSTQAQATYYDQYYYDKSYTGTYHQRHGELFAAALEYVQLFRGRGGQQQWPGQTTRVGFIGNVNYFHRIKGWETSGSFSYAQNVQSVLITYTTSYYNYTARIRRRLGYGWAWLAAYSGSHTGLTQQAGSDNRSEGYSTSLSSRRFTLTGNYTKSTGQSILTSAGLVALPPTPGVPAIATLSSSTGTVMEAVFPRRRCGA